MSVKLTRVCRAALVVLILALPFARPVCADEALTPQQKAAVDQVIHDYILSHPEIVVEALKAAKDQSDAQAAQRARQMISTRRQELVENPDDFVGGNPKGNATLIEFFDYRCPYCKEIEPTLDALLQEDPKLRIVYKEFPILGPASIYAARAAIAAKKQGKYAAFHHAMMTTKGDITNDVVLKVASSVGLDLTKLKADMDAPDTERIIKANYALAGELDIQGTPGLIVGDMMIPGAVDLTTLRNNIAAARKGG